MSGIVHGLTVEITSRKDYDFQCGVLNLISSSFSLTSNDAATDTPIPVPTPIKYDDTQNIVPFQYALFRHPAGVLLSLEDDYLSEQERTLIELKIGSYLRTLHDNVLNEWYGQTWAPKEWSECISWQEAFALMFETALDAFEALNVNLEQQDVLNISTHTFSMHELRKSLGRAIGYFLFDDVEVPSLIWCGTVSSSNLLGVKKPTPYWRSRVLLNLTTREPVCFLGWNTNSGPRTIGSENSLGLGPIWGDPLMEGIFSTNSSTTSSLSSSDISNTSNSPNPATQTNPSTSLSSAVTDPAYPTIASTPSGPSAAILEGYGGSPVIFSRQNTKRLWYDAYITLLEILSLSGTSNASTGSTSSGNPSTTLTPGGNTSIISTSIVNAHALSQDTPNHESQINEARKRLAELAEKLKNAPCY